MDKLNLAHQFMLVLFTKFLIQNNNDHTHKPKNSDKQKNIVIILKY